MKKTGDNSETEKDISDINRTLGEIGERVDALENPDIEIQRALLAGTDVISGTSFSNIANGNDITLSHPYTDYDYLEMYAGTTGNALFIVPVSEFERALEVAKSAKSETFSGTFYLIVGTENAVFSYNAKNFTETKWAKVQSAENQKLYAVYGIKRRKA